MLMSEFIAQTGIAMTTEETDHNPHMDGSETMNNWRCILRVTRDGARRSMMLVFSMGVALHGAPSCGDVIDCLASDASSAEDTSYEDWCNEIDWDPDSRKAERCYKTIQRQAKRLKDLLGDADYDTLLYNVERG